MKVKYDLKDILKEYGKSKIQSEAEVRSKLIVPLLEYLGYPSWLRAEEFPVYGFEGRKRLPAKNADYIFFTEKEFGDYRKFKKEDIEWVKNHSLLVVEAKKPGELEQIQGQAEYYTFWTRAIAYIVTDGVEIEGCYFNLATADKTILRCHIDELKYYEQELQSFSYDNMKYQKEKSIDMQLGINVDAEIITSAADLELPEVTINYIREAMGRNAIGKDNLEVVSLFLNSTDFYLQQKMRYDIPEYMLDISREFQEAELYIDGNVFPYQNGEIIHSYWNDMDRYLFTSEFVEILMEYSNSKLKIFEMGYHVLDRRVAERLIHFDIVKKCMNAQKFTILIKDHVNKMLSCEIGQSKKIWKTRSDEKRKIEIWIDGLEKMRALEEYYEVVFDLEWIQGWESIRELYEAIDIVYNGIAMKANCIFRMPGDFSEEDILIEQPTVFQENKKIELPTKFIHGITFVPERTIVLPGMLHFENVPKGEFVEIEMCCQYKAIQAEG